MLRILMVVGGLLGLLGLIGCGPDIEDFHYSPHPAVAAVPSTQPQEGPPVEVMATILGIRHDTPDNRSPYVIDVRIRVQNYSSRLVVFDPRSLELTNSELVRFPPPRVSVPEAFSIRPDQPATVDSTFPLPSGIPIDKLDLNALQLRWALEIDGQRIGQVVNFRRVVYRVRYYDPYWDYPPYPYGFYGGVVIVHRR